MGVTDYRCKSKDEIAKIPLIAHEIIVAKHKRRELILSLALVLSVVIGTLTHFIR